MPQGAFEPLQFLTAMVMASRPVVSSVADLLSGGLEWTPVLLVVTAIGGSDATIEDIEQALMQSPTHRHNILEPTFDRMAVGMAEGPNGQVAFVEIFRAAPGAVGTQWVWFPTASAASTASPHAAAAPSAPALDTAADTTLAVQSTDADDEAAQQLAQLDAAEQA